LHETVLIVDDERLIRWSLGEALKSWGYRTLEASDVASALAVCEEEFPDAVLLDVNLPDGSGLDVLRALQQREINCLAIMITADIQVDDAIAAIRGGAFDFISKPLNMDELDVTLRNGLEARRLRREVSAVRREAAQTFSFDEIVGKSQRMQEMAKLARRVAASETATVLLQGESGTGKDLVAKAIHYGSARAERPFVAINCAAIPGTLIESEFFGYEKGAFTDAKARKEGLFEQASGGTLFLDEIGELEIPLQAKLLRVLEDNTFRRVGGLKDVTLDARVIAASNRDLRAECEAGRFRSDLFYRLSVIQIDIPPVRERGEDVLLLASHFLSRLRFQLRRPAREFDGEVKRLFLEYAWPGNVRELRNVVERALILEDGPVITTRWLPSTVTGISPAEPGEPPVFLLPSGGVQLEEVENSLVRQALQRTRGNQTRAAELLGISRDQLRYRQKRLAEEPVRPASR
jgi:DNA-binding NtrC family response regulator